MSETVQGKPVEPVVGQWMRGVFTSIWEGPDLSLIVVQRGGPSEAWQWTCRGWREPENDWMWAASREAAEQAALAFYLEKDE